jgi:hypothetical protein
MNREDEMEYQEILFEVEAGIATLTLNRADIRLGVHSTLEESLVNAAACQSLCHFTDDHMETLSALFAKRKPVFQGK